VDDEIPIIEEDPAALAETLDAQRPDALLLEGLLDVPGDGRDLPVGRTRAEEEIIGESGPLPDIKCADVLRPLLLRQAGAADQDLPCRDGRSSFPRGA
jgi:hypothetical protein